MAKRTIYELKVTLCHIKPPIWRLLQVPGSITLAQLHDVIQIAMGWDNSHLHCFETADATYKPSYAMGEEPEYDDEGTERTRLESVAPSVKCKFKYTYDFGDNWEHDVVVRRIDQAATGEVVHPFCLGGKRACPPDDIGGVPGFYYFLEAMSDPTHEGHEQMKEWVREGWDPEYLDLQAINAQLAPPPSRRKPQAGARSPGKRGSKGA